MQVPNGARPLELHVLIIIIIIIQFDKCMCDTIVIIMGVLCSVSLLLSKILRLKKCNASLLLYMYMYTGI